MTAEEDELQHKTMIGSGGKKILVTGFRPLERWPSNASETLVRSLEAELPVGTQRAEYEFFVFESCSSTLGQQLDNLLDRVQPDVCLFFGQSRGRTCINIERVAQNLIDFADPDASGEIVFNQPIDPDGPAAFFTNLASIDSVVPTLLAAGIPAKYSNFAGNSLCNQVYYQALRAAFFSQGREERKPQSVFIHVPILPEQVIAEWPEAPFVTLDFLRATFATISAVCAGE